MPANDPIGDMIARIKNAGERRRSKVVTPASTLRQRVLDVLQTEGYIRGYSRTESAQGFPQFCFSPTITACSLTTGADWYRPDMPG